MSTLKNGEFGIDLDKEKILWTDRKRRTIFSLPLSFTKYTLTETKLIVQRGCFNLREDEIQLYRVRDIAFKQNFYERLCRVGSIHLCSTDAMTPEIDIRRIKNPRDVKEVLSKTIEACRKANGIRTSEMYDTQYAVSEYAVENWADDIVPPVVINSCIWAIVANTAAEMQKDNRFLRRKEICDTEFFEIATRIYNELLGFAARKYEILDIGE